MCNLVTSIVRRENIFLTARKASPFFFLLSRFNLFCDANSSGSRRCFLNLYRTWRVRVICCHQRFYFSHLPFPFLLRFNQLAHRVLDGDFGTEEDPLVRRDNFISVKRFAKSLVSTQKRTSSCPSIIGTTMQFNGYSFLSLLNEKRQVIVPYGVPACSHACSIRSCMCFLS